MYTKLLFVGLTILEMATLKSSEEIYEPNTYNIQASVLWERIKFVADYYPPELCHIIRMMTEFGTLLLLIDNFLALNPFRSIDQT